MRVLSWIVGVPVAIVAVAFAVANRHPVRIELWPLPVDVEAPLYLAVLGTLILGLLVGALVAWFGGHRWRSLARNSQRRAATLERELETLRKPANDAAGRNVVVPGQRNSLQ